MHKPKPRLAIFASGRGSNAEALMHAFERGFLPAELALVVSNKSQAPVLEIAQKHGYPIACIPNEGLPREKHELQVLEAIRQAEINHIVLAGYMRILGPEFLNTFPSRVLNIHPSLLPEFRGMHAVEQQWKAGVRVAGATVHVVTPEIDSGPIILQGSITVDAAEGLEALKHRILTEVEHQVYPRAVWLFVQRQYGSLTSEQLP